MPLVIRPIRLNSDAEASNPTDFANVIIGATDAYLNEKGFMDADVIADFRISSDALNFLRVEWRLREEWGSLNPAIMGRVKEKICTRRKYESEEFDATLAAVARRPRLPYGMTAMDVATKRLITRPIRLTNTELEESRYARGVMALAIHLQDIQKEKPILLPVDQVREILAAKKVVVAGTILQLVKSGLLKMTKADYNTGSAREYLCLAREGQDFVYVQK